MKVGYTKDVEKKRVELIEENRHNSTWELHNGTNIVEALHKAKELGWKEDKVQVRYENIDNNITYYVEPYEKGCGCRGLLKYKDFFD